MGPPGQKVKAAPAALPVVWDGVSRCSFLALRRWARPGCGEGCRPRTGGLRSRALCVPSHQRKKTDF